MNAINPPPSAQYDYTKNIMEQKKKEDKEWAEKNPLKWFRITARDIAAPDNAMTVEDVSMGMLAFTAVVGAPATVRNMLGAEGVAVGGVNAAATTEQISFTRAGKWMSEKEYQAMKNSGHVQKGSGGVTFASTSGSASYKAQAGKGSVYVEYDVPTSSLLPGGKSDWVKTVAENANGSVKTQIKKQGAQTRKQETYLKY